jgi:hypothetical protein
LALVDADVNTANSRALAYRQLTMVDFAKNILPTEAEIRAVLHLAQVPSAASALVQGISQDRRAFVFRALAWLLKLGVLKAVAPQNTPRTSP